jgi:tetratricopeptide (TPR) repeat protein
MVLACATCAAVACGPVGCEALRGFDEDESHAVSPSRITTTQQERLDAARAASAAGDYDGALSMFQDILADNPMIATAYLGIGDIYVIRKDYAKAEPAYGRAARLEPRSFDAQYGHGLALQMLDEFVEAVRAYHRALTIDPANPKANLNLATTYLQLQEPLRAVVFAEKAVEVDPANGAAHANLGAIYEELQRYPEAIDAYIAAIELMGNRPPLLLNLINALGKERRYREAANTAATLVKIAPSAGAYERLGWCHFKLREYDASVQAYRDATEIEPDHWPALNGIGVNALNRWLLSKKRDTAARREARNAFRRSLRANENQPKVVSLMLNYDL